MAIRAVVKRGCASPCGVIVACQFEERDRVFIDGPHVVVRTINGDELPQDAYPA
jgi:hypothetical protein